MVVVVVVVVVVMVVLVGPLCGEEGREKKRENTKLTKKWVCMRFPYKREWSLGFRKDSILIMGLDEDEMVQK